MRYDLLRRRWRHEPRAEQRTVDEEFRRLPFIMWKSSLGEEHVSLHPALLRAAREAVYS